MSAQVGTTLVGVRGAFCTRGAGGGAGCEQAARTRHASVVRTAG